MNNTILNEDLYQIHSAVKKRGKWKNATILITGCAGFLGFYFVNYFTRYGLELGIKKIIALDNFLLGKPKWITDLVKKFPHLLFLKSFDISNHDISQVDGISNTNYVIHAASIASPSFYRKFPVETIDANIWGLRNMLNFFKKKNKLNGFLFFSSSEIYGDPDVKFIPTDEEYRGNVSCTGPRACYDESKRFGETLCWVYSKNYGIPITVARPFNNYGPGMSLNDKRLPADFAKHILNNEDLIILSDGTPTRTFCYISDAIIGYILCLTYGRYNYFNIGMDRPEVMVKEFAEFFIKAGKYLFKYNKKIKYKKSLDTDYMTDNPNRRCPSITKAKKILGFKPLINVEDGVMRYLMFIRNKF